MNRWNGEEIEREREAPAWCINSALLKAAWACNEFPPTTTNYNYYKLYTAVILSLSFIRYLFLLISSPIFFVLHNETTTTTIRIRDYFPYLDAVRSQQSSNRRIRRNREEHNNNNKLKVRNQKKREKEKSYIKKQQQNSNYKKKLVVVVIVVIILLCWWCLMVVYVLLSPLLMPLRVMVRAQFSGWFLPALSDLPGHGVGRGPFRFRFSPWHHQRHSKRVRERERERFKERFSRAQKKKS